MFDKTLFVVKSLKQKYIFLSVVLSHTFLLVFVLNILAVLWLRKHRSMQDYSAIYNIFNYQALHTEKEACKLDSTELISMFQAFVDFKRSGRAEFVYHPATEFQLNQFSIEGVDIYKHSSGFNVRLNSLAPMKEAKKYQIFCLGGSTTYGTFCKNHQTWPAFLEAMLDSVQVVNFGVPGFVPTQETSQFIYLMKMGYRPDLVIFFDGGNIGPPYDASDFTKSIAQKFNRQQESGFLGSLPIIKLLKGQEYEELDVFQTQNIDFIDLETDTKNNDIVVSRLVQNAQIRKEIAELYGVKILQFIQPNGNYNYPLDYCKEPVQKHFQSEGAKMIQYNLDQIFTEVLKQDVGYIDLSSAFSDFGKASIIDITHYTPEFNHYIAERIVSYVDVDTSYNHFSVGLKSGVPFDYN